MATEFNLPGFQFDLGFLFFVSVSVSMAAFLNPNSYDVLKKLDEHLLSHLVSPLTGTIVPRIILLPLRRLCGLNKIKESGSRELCSSSSKQRKESGFPEQQAAPQLYHWHIRHPESHTYT
ncbi:hypothetical protein F2Q69_00024253 [Brassica cretica]|uniref:Uncharacterized protein n=1 Tax=Brassica cretica TaxID=69181 RepID=A0A8S9Q2C2_BRACR|nr:hypothetical protein F2Q69_00024253 [Brassica cretica]